MNVAYFFSKEGLSRGFIYNALIKGGLLNKPNLALYVSVYRGIV